MRSAMKKAYAFITRMFSRGASAGEDVLSINETIEKPQSDPLLRAIEVCQHCRDGVALYPWQGYYTHRLYKKPNPTMTQFQHVTCGADAIWKEANGRPGISD